MIIITHSCNNGLFSKVSDTDAAEISRAVLFTILNKKNLPKPKRCGIIFFFKQVYFQINSV